MDKATDDRRCPVCGEAARPKAPAEIRETIEAALIFSRDTIQEHAAEHIVDAGDLIAAETARHNRALAWLRGAAGHRESQP